MWKYYFVSPYSAQRTAYTMSKILCVHFEEFHNMSVIILVFMVCICSCSSLYSFSYVNVYGTHSILLKNHPKNILFICLFICCSCCCSFSIVTIHLHGANKQNIFAHTFKQDNKQLNKQPNNQTFVSRYS